MPTDYANFNGVQSFLKQAGDRFIAEIVKPQVLERSPETDIV